MTTPDFAVIGHAVRDLVSGGWRLGGTVTFAARQAQRLSLRAGIVTRVGPEAALETLLPGVELAGRPSMESTSFENVYDGAHRRQRALVQAEAITAEDVPPAWRAAPIVLLGPVCGEISPGFGATFPRSLVGVAAQGWLRRVDRQRRVRRRAWTGLPFWSDCHVLFVSEEDLGRRRDQLEQWTAEVPVVVVTRDRRGAQVYSDGRWRHIEAFPAREVDPTGAGDIFAAAFLVRYHENEDVATAARFALAAAARSVEAAGLEAIAAREEIEARMKEHPELVLR